MNFPTHYEVRVTEITLKEGEKYTSDVEIFSQKFPNVDVAALARFLNQEK